jgi:hypothetical protein
MTWRWILLNWFGECCNASACTQPKSDAVEAEKMVIPSSSDLITGLVKADLLSIGKEKDLDAWGRRLWPKA